MAQSAYDRDLDRNPANFQPLTPLSFLARSALVFPDRPAVVDGELRFTYRRFYGRCRQLASALARRGTGKGDTVSAMLANTTPLLEAHYGVPMTKAVLHAINTRLDAAVIAFMLDHAETKVLIFDREFEPTIAAALSRAKARPLLAARREGWFEAVSEWATILSPVAAAVTLVFAGLALRHAGATPEAPTELAGAPGVVELVQPGQALPSAFEGDSVPDLDVVMTVLYEAEDPR